MRLWLLTSVAALGAALTWFAVWRAAARVLPDRVPDPADAPKPPPVSPLEAAGLALSLALALARTLPLMSRGFSYDEIWSVTDFFGTPSLWHAVSTFAEYNNHVFYSVLAWGAARVLGPAEWAYRAPALLFGVASIVALWWFARPRLGPAGGVLAALLLGTSPVAVAMGATARGYTGMVFFSLVATAAFFRLFHPAAGRGTGAAWLLATFLGIYTHLMAGTVLAVQVLMLGVVAWRQRGAPASAPLLSTARFDRIWKLMGCVGVLTAVAYLPVWRSLAGTLVSGEPSALVPSFPMDVVAFLAGTERGVSWPAVLLGLTAGYGLTAGWRSGFLERTTVQLLFLLPVLGLWLARPE